MIAYWKEMDVQGVLRDVASKGLGRGVVAVALTQPNSPFGQVAEKQVSAYSLQTDRP